MSRNTMRLVTLVVVLFAFAALSLWALGAVGYMGIWRSGLASPGAIQILADLVIACLLMCIWMVRDARDQGLNVWPFVVITLASGSFGPLLYLILRQWRARGVAA